MTVIYIRSVVRLMLFPLLLIASTSIKAILSEGSNETSSSVDVLCPYDYDIIEVFPTDDNSVNVEGASNVIDLLPIRLRRQGGEGDDHTTVEFSVANVWPTTSLDYFFVTYTTDIFSSLHCELNEDLPVLVEEDYSYSSSITSYCNAKQGKASTVRLYVRDSTFHHAGDNADDSNTVPHCCHDPLEGKSPSDVGAVRVYIVVMNCSPTCPEDEQIVIDNSNTTKPTEPPSEVHDNSGTDDGDSIVKLPLPSPEDGPVPLPEISKNGGNIELDVTNREEDSLTMLYEVDTITDTNNTDLIIEGNLKPVGRSYNGHPWEVYGTMDHELSGVAFDCSSSSSCVVTLPPTYQEGRVYVLKSETYPHELSTDDLAARFLEKATFGPTKGEIASFPIDSPESWVYDQMHGINISSHRQFYRERATNWHAETNHVGTLGAHPCKESSRYRKYAVTTTDHRRYVTLEASPYDSSKIVFSIGGHVRTIVDGPFQYGSHNKIEGNATLGRYEVCQFPFEGVGSRLLLKGSFGCKQVYFNGVYGNPAVNFDDSHLSLLEHPIVSLEKSSYEEVLTPFYFQGQVEVLHLTESISDANACNISDDFVAGYLTEAFVVGQTNDDVNGTQYWIHTPVFNLRNNDINTPLHDGGNLALTKTKDAPENVKRFRALCSSAPRTFLNEDSCRLSDDACYVKEGEDVDIELTIDNLKLIYDATGGKDGEETLYVYVLTALRNDPDHVDPPCTPGARSRWIISDEGVCDSDPGTLWDGKTEEAFRTLLTSSYDKNTYMKDVFFPTSTSGSISCSANDLNKYDFKIKIDGRCYENTHPDNYQVFDMTYWTTDAHMGNFRENKIKAFADTRQTWFLEFPDWHDMERWHIKKENFPVVGRLGDNTTLKSLPPSLLREDVAQAFGSARAIISSGKIPVCGSPFEVENIRDTSSGPLHQGGFDMRTLYNSTTGGFFRHQRLTVFAEIALKSRDQLRQRTAFALSQIFSVSPDSGASTDISESHLSYYDIFVRHAFGNYFDIMREVTMHPIMSYMLTYRNGQSTAYSLIRKGLMQTPDENYAREIMQLFSIGTTMLNNNGTVALDDDGRSMLSYTNEDIAEYAKVYVGLEMQQIRGNIDGNNNQVDPLRIRADLKDHFPKLGLDRQYIGDGYPLCSDIPDKHFLKAGAEYRLLGSDPNPQLLNEPNSYYGASAKRISLNFTSSHLALALCNGNGTHCDPTAKVILTADYECTGIECDVVTPRAIEASEGLWFEYIRPPCINQAFYDQAMTITKRNDCGWERYMCGNPVNTDASTMCCNNASSKDRPWRRELFGGERVNLLTAEQRCSADEGLRLCFDARVENSDCLGQPPDTEGYRTYNNGGCDQCNVFYWLSTPCSIRTKIAPDGSIALVHEHSVSTKTHLDTYRQVRNDTKMFFRADWKDSDQINDFISNYDANCIALGCIIDDNDGVCQCPTSVNETMAFYDYSELFSIDNIMKVATYGAFPQNYSFAETSLEGVKVYPSGELTIDTVFEVLDFNGRTHYRKNLMSTVEIGDGGLLLRNPVSFWSLSEFTERDARYELDAALEHYFYHQNTAPFVAYRFAQRFGVSNPSPRYIDAIATAFRTGSYNQGSQSFGSNKYGCLEATVAAVVLDRESSDQILDLDPAFGQLKEPYLKLFRLYRSLEFGADDNNPLPRFSTSIQDLIGQEPHKIPNVFSYFKPQFAPPAMSSAGIVSPESQVLNGPTTVNGMNLFLSFIKYGASNCYSGLGTSGVVYNGWMNSCIIGDNVYNLGNTKYLPTTYGLNETSADDVVNDLATIMTSGRLGSREIYKEAFTKTLESGKGPFEAMINVQQLISLSPEFHATNFIKKSGNNRSLPDMPNATNIPYKAVIFLMLSGGMDSWNVLVPESCSKTNADGENVHDQYLRMRDMLAFDRDKGEFDLKIDPQSEQPCESFAIHNELAYIKELYDDGDVIFLANTGVVNSNGMNTVNYNAKTRSRLFDHAAMQEETKKIDPYADFTGTGVLGRAKDVLSLRGHVVNSMSINEGSILVTGSPGLSSPPTVVSQNGAKVFAHRPHSEAYFDIEDYAKEINAELDPFNSFYSEQWAAEFSKGVEQGSTINQQLEDVSVDSSIWGERDGSLYDKMNIVSKLIKTRDDRHSDRDFFFSEYGSFDHHSAMKQNLAEKLSDVNKNLRKIVEELKKDDLWNNVTIVVASEFARTITPNNGAGSDHAWGGNYFILGGSLRGGRVLGKYPSDLTVSSPLNAASNSRVRFIPTTSWDSIWHGVIQWLGVENSDDIDYCLPNKDNTINPVENHDDFPLLNKSDLYEVTAIENDPSLSIERSLRGRYGK